MKCHRWCLLFLWCLIALVLLDPGSDQAETANNWTSEIFGHKFHVNMALTLHPGFKELLASGPKGWFPDPPDKPVLLGNDPVLHST